MEQKSRLRPTPDKTAFATLKNLRSREVRSCKFFYAPLTGLVTGSWPRPVPFLSRIFGGKMFLHLRGLVLVLFPKKHYGKKETGWAGNSAHLFPLFHTLPCHPERSFSEVKDPVIFQEGFCEKELFILRCKRHYPFYNGNACSAGYCHCHNPRVGTRGYKHSTPPG